MAAPPRIAEFQSLASPTGNIGDARAFVGQLADVSTFLFEVWNRPDSVLISSGSELDRLCLEVLRSTSHTVVVALLARYYSEWAANPSDARRDEFMRVLKAAASFWTLWRTSRATTKGIDDVHRKLMAIGHPTTGLPALARRAVGILVALPAAAHARMALKSLLSTRVNITTEADWIAKVTVQQLYQTSRQLAKFLLLCAYDDRIEDQTAPGLIKRGVAGCFPALTPEAWKAHYSVEHIAPQTLSAGDTSYGQSIYDQGLVDRLGNLTLMPVDLNQLIGNKTWPYKRGVYGVLSETDPLARVTQMQQQLPGLAQATKNVLASASVSAWGDYNRTRWEPLVHHHRRERRFHSPPIASARRAVGVTSARIQHSEPPRAVSAQCGPDVSRSIAVASGPRAL